MEKPSFFSSPSRPPSAPSLAHSVDSSAGPPPPLSSGPLHSPRRHCGPTRHPAARPSYLPRPNPSAKPTLHHQPAPAQLPQVAKAQAVAHEGASTVLNPRSHASSQAEPPPPLGGAPAPEHSRARAPLLPATRARDSRRVSQRGRGRRG
ncbi:proline-rich receptor-like protein kinase PERK9 [Sorghum bicolor]|uniref:proline-rich receptor-like protein kinase PERK9 n=1 Tax=Sorghum bicolor TaxID=4558 RepID=UPI000B423BAA|nr:proline-rich receptor-like protein kinase PERK9 [Sorghum bicolor]|eukprot:XP_021309098.1 proline-rich receptor-like protein kinase PERK9 [Sorghum bicolor]